MSQEDETVESLALIRNAQAGDLKAYERLFERYYSDIQRKARQRLGAGLRREVDSCDVVNEAMIEAIRSFDRFEVRSKPAFLAWLYRIVENRIRNIKQRVNAIKRDRGLEVALDHIQDAVSTGRLVLEPVDERSPPDEQAIEREEAALVRKCLEQLDERQRSVILLRESEQLSWEEVARQINGSSPNAARMLFVRAKIALKRALEAESFEG